MTKSKQTGATVSPLAVIAQDPRIGTSDARPQITVTGQPIVGAPSTLNIGAGYIVALDAFPSDAQDMVIATLRALVATATAPTVRDVIADTQESTDAAANS